MGKSTFEEEIGRSGFLCYTVVGVSMEPLLRQHRDVVTVKKPAGRLKRLDVALYKTPDGRYILHRVLKVRENDYVICGDNCVRREYGITDDIVVGVMESCTRNGRAVSLDSVGYRLYSHAVADLYYPKAAALWSLRAARRAAGGLRRALK